MISSMPFGVLKKFFALRRMAQSPRFEPLQIRRNDQALHAHALQKRDTFLGPSTNAAVASASASIARRNHRRARHRVEARPGARIERCAERPSRNRRRCIQPDSKRAACRSVHPPAAGAESPRTRRAVLVRAAQIQVAAGIDGEIHETAPVRAPPYPRPVLSPPRPDRASAARRSVMVCRSASSSTSR